MLDILNCFGSMNRSRIESSLNKLLSHVDINDLVICGRLAICYQLMRKGIEFDYERDINDLDVLLPNIKSIKTSVSKDFLIYHYHDYAGKSGHADDFFIALLEESSKIKLDIFSYEPYIPLKPDEITLFGHKVKIRNAEDQLATQIIESSGVLTGSVIDPKWLRNMSGLIKISDFKKVEEYFRKKGNNNNKGTAEETYNSILAYLKGHSEQSVEKTTRRKPYICRECESTKNFKVEPMEKIYAILGYTE